MIYLKFSQIKSNILIVLLTLEYLILSLILGFLRSHFILSSNLTFLIVFFVLAVCEAGIGLRLLVANSRYSSKSFMNLVYFF